MSTDTTPVDAEPSPFVEAELPLTLEPVKKKRWNGDPPPGSALPDIRKLLPQDAYAEQGCLCSFLIAPLEVGALCSARGLKHFHFHIPSNAIVYSTLVQKWADSEPIDIITLTGTLRNENSLNEAGGIAQVSALFTFLPTAANADDYISTIIDKWKLREAIRLFTFGAARCYEEQDNGPRIFSEYRSKLETLESDFATQKKKTMKEVVTVVLERLDRLNETRTITGLTTGFAELNLVLDGLHKQEMIVIAARPSMGKTALAMNIAEHVAFELCLPVLIFSLEMSTEALVTRFLCGRARVNPRNVQEYGLTPESRVRLTRAGSGLVGSRMIIEDDESYKSIERMTARAMQLKRQFPDLALIVGDYFQLQHSDSGKDSDNRNIELTRVSAGWKMLGKALDLTTILLAQVNRPKEQGGTFQLHHLKDCGALEQDADVVGGIERESDTARDARLIIKKQRNGPLKAIPLTFLAEFTRFEDRKLKGEDETEELPFKEPPKTRERYRY